MAIWGEHAMAGDPGAEVIDELEPREGEIVSEKRHYGAFDGTGLDEQLRERGVDEVVVTGQHTHICVRHSSYGALIRGYQITVPRDAVCAFEGVSENRRARVPHGDLRRERDDGRRARRRTRDRFGVAPPRHGGAGLRSGAATISPLARLTA